jgi:hypothetical protein
MQQMRKIETKKASSYDFLPGCHLLKPSVMNFKYSSERFNFPHVRYFSFKKIESHRQLKNRLLFAKTLFCVTRKQNIAIKKIYILKEKEKKSCRKNKEISCVQLKLFKVCL